MQKKVNDVDLTISLKKIKSPKELKIKAVTLPSGADATAELIKNDTFITLVLGGNGRTMMLLMVVDDF